MVVDVAYAVGWAKAFVFTEIVEAPLYRRFVPTRWGPAFAASALTHPFVWFAFPWIGERFAWGWGMTSVVSEVFAVVVEALFFWRVARISFRRAFAVSVLANGSSVALGLFVRYTVGGI